MEGFKALPTYDLLTPMLGFAGEAISPKSTILIFSSF